MPTRLSRLFVRDDVCSCCKLSRASKDIKYYDGGYSDFERAARNDCPRCAFVFKCVRWGIPTLFRIKDVSMIRVWENHAICVYLPGDPGWMYIDLFSIDGKPPRDPTPLKLSRTRHSLPTSTSNDLVFEVAKDWIQQCTTSHIRCRLADSDNPGGRTQPWSPTRILDLRDGQVRLRETPFSENYACLSHCWGKDQGVLKTTLDREDEFKIIIPWKELPKSFQDAIGICRKLGIYFLWIDSICIIQDSNEDWEREAAVMADIYENAFITIAATKANGPSMGCYSDIESKYASSLLPGYDDIYIRQELPSWPEHWSERNRAKDMPLLNRGWIYQEMRLSSRVIHFCSQEVIWECPSKRRSLSGCNDEDFSPDAAYYAHQMYEVVPYWKLRDNPRLLWYRTVQEYSRLALTFTNDRMPALSAMTKRMEDLRVNDRFIAGLWEKTLLLDLLWIVWPAPKEIVQPTDLGPSWSWMSLPWQIQWDSACEATLKNVKLREIRYVSVGPTHMGRFSEARITIQAPLIPAKKLFSHKMAVIHDFKPDTYGFSTKDLKKNARSDYFIIPIGSTPMNQQHDALCVRKLPDTGYYKRLGVVNLKHTDIGDDYEEQEPSEGQIPFQKLEGTLESLPVSNITLV